MRFFFSFAETSRPAKNRRKRKGAAGGGNVAGGGPGGGGGAGMGGVPGFCHHQYALSCRRGADEYSQHVVTYLNKETEKKT